MQNRQRGLVALFVSAAACVSTAETQQPPVHQAPNQPAPAARRAAAPFELNAIEQAYLDQLLANWEQKSGEIKTFRCDFERWEYSPTYGGYANLKWYDIPWRKEVGELSYQKPDKGSFRIKQVNQLQPVPEDLAPGQSAPAPQWTPLKVVGEHWVCDGESVYEYRHRQKQLVVQPIPPELQGQAIANGPLPFVFGAKADDLKKRYWMKVQKQPDRSQIWLLAYPKFPADAANYKTVRLSLERETLLPRAMELQMPDRSRHTYIFKLDTASVNATFDKIKNLFAAPRAPIGWQRVVENGARQAQQPGPAVR